MWKPGPKIKTFIQENASKNAIISKNGSHYVLKFRFQWVNQFSLIQSLNHFKLHYSSRGRQASWQQIIENISPREFHSQIEPRFCLNLETMYYNVYRTCFTRAQLSKHVQNDTFWPCHCCYKTIIVNACNSVLWYTVECSCSMVQYNIILCTSFQEWRQNINQSLNP